MDKRSAILAFTISALLAIPVHPCSATEVTDIRINSEAGKTRIVIELDGPIQYQARYIPPSSISIRLPETGPGSVRRTAHVSDELVDVVTLEEMMENMVGVNILLKKLSNFTIFPLESPDRIVIDVTSGEMVLTHETVGIGQSTGGSIDPHPSDSELEDQDSSDLVAGANLKFINKVKSILPFSISKSMVVRFCFDALLVASLIIIAVNLRRVTRISNKDPVSLKKYQTFADMVKRDRRSRRKQNYSANEQHIVTVKTGTSERQQKRRKKNGNGSRAGSTQKQYRKVHELAQLGMAPLDISRRSNVPIGEVNLILDLSKVSSEDKPN